MLKNIKSETNRPEVRELLGYADVAGREDEEGLINRYKTDDRLHLYGYEDDGLIVGLLGFESKDQGVTHLHHIAVLPENRLKGYGRGMLLQLIKDFDPRQITADTDEEGAQFFRNLSFTVYGSEDPATGLEYFHCVYNTEDEE
ncbi:GNAT family N-acetyltransferase [Paenibacillus sp. P96]|uniref:GNAT family N-acetyltransferase n=1 Tax=Paenibacillus zeirhizosphaerae TaxID=2987519 RepID=A0ABT9FSF1_9BACL|nr:GNAT family N-acetyltransferase [Paenibacillus sp. P96]MDP4097599.1 GNAT family N-acetyltransferase [Paenibacillus sp. P96]